MTTTTTTEIVSPECKCCDGRGWQTLFTGERIMCSACGGSGVWPSVPLPSPCDPIVPLMPGVPYDPYRSYPHPKWPPWEITC